MPYGQPGPLNLITDVDGIEVGNAHDADVGTGTTVIIPIDRAVAGGDIRGGGPGTRETDALNPENLVDEMDGIVLSGGSAYGLSAASAVVDWLGARGRGFAIPGSPHVTPVVPAAILFDLANGGNKNWGEAPPYAALGRIACEALTSAAFPLGNVGAGYGANAGVLKGGLGSASVVEADGLQVGAVVAVNSMGSALIPGTGHFWAWSEEIGNEFGGRGAPENIPETPLWEGTKAAGAASASTSPGQNTTIAVVATNVALTPAQAKRVAIMAHDGLARAIFPLHTPMDGDSVFVLSTAKMALGDDATPLPLALARVGLFAASCLTRAVARGVYEATSVPGRPAYKDVYP